MFDEKTLLIIIVTLLLIIVLLLNTVISLYSKNKITQLNTTENKTKKNNQIYKSRRLEIGQVIEGKDRYIVVKEFISGGMGVTYLGKYAHKDEYVVLKIIIPGACSEKSVLRLIKEGEFTSTLNHPNLVKGIELIKNEQIIFVMEFIHGNNLDKVLEKKSIIPEKEAIDIAKQILNGLLFLHEKDIIHRDVKPGNIILTSENKVKLVDFGLVKNIHEQGLTTEGIVMGSPFFFSPEQLVGGESTTKIDIYSLGVVLYRMVTGIYPFDGENVEEIARKRLTEIPKRPNLVEPMVSTKLSNIIMDMLSSKPDNRPTSKELIERI